MLNIMGVRFIILKIEEPETSRRFEHFLITVNHDPQTDIHHGKIPQLDNILGSFLTNTSPQIIDDELQLIIAPAETEFDQILKPDTFWDFDWVDINSLNTADWYEIEDEEWTLIHKFLNYYQKKS